MGVITKSQLKSLLGFETDKQLAELFGLTPSAISQWGEDKPIPQKRELRLRYELRPDLFAGTDKQAA